MEKRNESKTLVLQSIHGQNQLGVRPMPKPITRGAPQGRLSFLATRSRGYDEIRVDIFKERTTELSAVRALFLAG